MYTAALFATLLAGSALAEHPVQSLMKRQQLTPDIIPSACQDTCQSALPIYNACLSGDQATCLSVCESDNFDAFVGCFNCIIQNVPGASSGDFQSAQQAIGQIESACQQVGSSVDASGLETGAAGSSAMGTGTGAGASFTSASSAIVIGGSSLSQGLSSAAGSATGAPTTSAPASQSSAPSATGSGAAATSSAPNAGIINAPQGLAALVLGAIGALAL